MAATYVFTTVDDTGDATELLGINNAGVLVGFFGSGTNPASNPTTAFVATPSVGAFTFGTINTSALGSLQSRATDISNTATVEITGYATDSVGGVKSFSVPGATAAAKPIADNSNGSATYVLGVNDTGALAGYYVDSGNGLDVGFAGTTAGAVTVQGARATRVTGINLAGDVSGVATIRGAIEGFVIVGGTTELLSGPAGATATMALGLNNQNQVVGDYVDGAGTTHGFVYEAATGEYTTIDAGIATVVEGINDQGHFVGYYVDPNNVTHGLLGTRLGGAQGSPQQVTNPLAGSSLSVILGSRGVSAGGSANVRLVDPGFGFATLFANAGSDTFVVSAVADTVVGGSNASVNASQGSQTVIFLGGGRNSVSSGAAATVIATTGTDAVTLGGGSRFFGSSSSTLATATVSADTTPAVGRAPILVAGGVAQLFVNGSNVDGDLLFGGSGINSFVGGAGASTMIGGAGLSFLRAGAGGGLIFGGTGGGQIYGASTTVAGNGALNPTTIVTGDAATTVTAYAGSVFLSGTGEHVAISGAASVGNLTLVGGGGGNTFVLSSRAGNDIVYGGAGTNDVFLGNGNSTIYGGGGANKFYVGTSAGGGSDTIVGFRGGIDVVDVSNFNARNLRIANSPLGNSRAIISLAARVARR